MCLYYYKATMKIVKDVFIFEVKISKLMKVTSSGGPITIPSVCI